jgi:hypothetical protein
MSEALAPTTCVVLTSPATTPGAGSSRMASASRASASISRRGSHRGVPATGVARARAALTRGTTRRRVANCSPARVPLRRRPARAARPARSPSRCRCAGPGGRLADLPRLQRPRHPDRHPDRRRTERLDRRPIGRRQGTRSPDPCRGRPRRGALPQQATRRRAWTAALSPASRWTRGREPTGWGPAVPTCRGLIGCLQANEGGAIGGMSDTVVVTDTGLPVAAGTASTMSTTRTRSRSRRLASKLIRRQAGQRRERHQLPLPAPRASVASGGRCSRSRSARRRAGPRLASSCRPARRRCSSCRCTADRCRPSGSCRRCHPESRRPTR